MAHNVPHTPATVTSRVESGLLAHFLTMWIWSEDLLTDWSFPSLQNVRLPYTTLLIYATLKMVDASYLCWQTKMIWSSSTTECPRQAARRSLTSLMICVLRTIFMSCTSIRPKTTLSCLYRIRWEEQVAVSLHLLKMNWNNGASYWHNRRALVFRHFDRITR